MDLKARWRKVSGWANFVEILVVVALVSIIVVVALFGL
jgi:hypothetical protein